jgi:hypothetical protein
LQGPHGTNADGRGQDAKRIPVAKRRKFGCFTGNAVRKGAQKRAARVPKSDIDIQFSVLIFLVVVRSVLTSFPTATRRIAMSLDYAGISLAELVVKRPARSQTFARLGFDYCCHGRTTLGEACRRKHLNVDQICRDLDSAQAALSTEDSIDWPDRSLAELIDHIQTSHHSYLRRELPRLRRQLESAPALVPTHPQITDLRSIVDALWQELSQHMRKEEKVLFPWIVAIE